MRLYGLIGYPLEHSFSKQYFTEKFIREGITDAAFEAFPIAAITDFPALLAHNPGLLGLSVTIPYKERVLDYVHQLSAEVEAIGATNSIKIRNGQLTAYNTDIIGFEQSFTPLLQPHHTKALVLGTGGAAKAVQYVLKKNNIPYITVTRTPNQDADYISYDNINGALLEEYKIIINCTPVGMYPAVGEAPLLPYDLLNSSHYLFDLVYKPAKTKFLEEGEKRGTVICNGFDMLTLQAEASWKIWNSEQD